MDDFSKKYLSVLGAIVLLAFGWWLVNRDTRVAELNAMLESDSMLASYVYPFRVLSLENGVAEVSSPRSAQIPAMRYLRTINPRLANVPVDHPDMEAAQGELIKHQRRAQELITDAPEVNSIRWTLDTEWYRERGITLRLDR